jgi:putative transposase
MSPERRRRAVEALRALLRGSVHFPCRVVGQHRSTQRRGGKVIDLEEVKRRCRLGEIAAEHIRWGRRMA